MKRVITNYIFDASLGTVTFELFTRITYTDIYTITNLTDGTLIFDPDTLPATVSGNVLTLSYDTSSMSDEDYLKIEYNYKQNYDGTNAVDGYDNVDILTDGVSGEKGVRVFTAPTDLETGAPITVSKSYISEGNTTTTPLGIDGIFTGEWVDTLNYS